MESETKQKEQIDITRLNRAERRRIGSRVHMPIHGRNLPFVKAIHKTVAEYNALRAKEIEADNQHDTKAH